MSRRSQSISFWDECDECQTVFANNEKEDHKEQCNKLINWDWKHNFIRDYTLHSQVETYTADLPTHVSQQDAYNLVFMSPAVMEKCDISLGSPVVIYNEEKIFVKLAWPMTDKKISSVSLLDSAIKLDGIKKPVKVHRLYNPIYLAKSIHLKYDGKDELNEFTDDFIMYLKIIMEGQIHFVGSKVHCLYYNRHLSFTVTEIIPHKKVKSKLVNDDNDLSLSLEKLSLKRNEVTDKIFYKTNYCTSCFVHREEITEVKVTHKLDDIGGYKDLIKNVQDNLYIALGKYGNFPNYTVHKGILLYGPKGVGKSMIAEGLLNECNIHTVTIKLSSLYKKQFREIETTLKRQFDEAKNSAPSIIYIKDLDILFLKKNSNDLEQKMLLTLTELLDEIHGMKIAILATTSALEAINSSLRTPDRLNVEFEVRVPTPMFRREILDKMLTKIKHELREEDIAHVAFVTHGYVGADLKALCSQAVTNCFQRKGNNNVETDPVDLVTLEDFNNALKIVNPSAMKAILVEVPNVRWSDIGGQKQLKLKLKQAVEWPLKHPEVFPRLGVPPPRGVLMFGPPGCSKTMIAKALATESKLNFISIKGPELFSKFVGESERAVREVFQKAKQVSPSIIFIDEIDAMGGERSTDSNSGGNVQERVLTQLLTMLDGITALGNVTLVAATNRPDKLDKALLRPGRFDRIIYVPLPDAQTREEIFLIKFQKMPVASDVNISDLVNRTEGFSGAEIQAICYEAAMKALEENMDTNIISKENFDNAFTIVIPRTPDYLFKIYDNFMN